MKVVAGRLRDADRDLIIDSNRNGARLLVATLRGTVTQDDRKPTPYEVAPMQAVGAVVTYDHDTLTLGGWSFRTVIAWDDIAAVWPRDDAPTEDQVDALIAEHAS